jgi:hypothetical protein
MNIFVLDLDPLKAAEYHCNKHVVKMILESAQMLCTAHWLSLLNSKSKKINDFKRVRDCQDWLKSNTGTALQPPWKMTHINHPCSIWTRESLENYKWHSRLGLALCDEYTKRYEKVHKSLGVHLWLSENKPLLPSFSLTEHPRCVPDDCKAASEDVVTSYRHYYNRYKNRFAKWEPKSQTPSWYTGK